MLPAPLQSEGRPGYRRGSTKRACPLTGVEDGLVVLLREGVDVAAQQRRLPQDVAMVEQEETQHVVFPRPRLEQALERSSLGALQRQQRLPRWSPRRPPSPAIRARKGGQESSAKAGQGTPRFETAPRNTRVAVQLPPGGDGGARV